MSGMRIKCVWITGLPCSGKTFYNNLISWELRKRGLKVHQLDGEGIRNTYISKGLGFGFEDKRIHLLRVAEIVRILNQHNIVAVCSFVSPDRRIRWEVREMVDGGFVEIYLKCDVEECIKRDVKGLWDRALKGEIKNWPGVDVEYEEGKPEIEIINNDESEIKNNVEKIMEYLDNCLVME